MFATTLKMVLVLVLVCLVTSDLQATAYTWSASAASPYNWDTAANWTGGSNFPGYNNDSGLDTVTFAFATTPNPTVYMDAPYSINTLTLTGTSGATLTINGTAANALTITNARATSLATSQILQGTGTIITTGAWLSLTGGTLGSASGAGLNIGGGVVEQNNTTGSTIRDVTFSGTGYLQVSSGTVTVSSTSANPASGVQPWQVGGGTASTTGTLNGAGYVSAPIRLLTSGTLSGTVTYGGLVTLSASGLTGAGPTISGGTFTGGVMATSGADTISGGNFASGALTVNGGALSVNATTIAPSSVSVSGGYLEGTGTITPAISMTGGTLAGVLSVGGLTSNGGTINPGETTSATGTPATIDVSGDTTLNTGTTLNYDSGDLVAITGNLTLAGTLNVNPYATMPAGSTTFTLFSYTGSLTNTATVAAPYGSYLTNSGLTVAAGSPNLLKLTFTRAAAIPFVWTGAGSANWGGQGNWNVAGAPISLTPLSGSGSSDSATFNLSAAPTIVNMEAAHSVWDITLSGAGGALTLNSTGANALTVADSTSGGGITVGGGQTLKGSGYVDVSASATGITLNGGTLAGTLNITGGLKSNSNGGEINPGETISGATSGTIGTIAVTGPVVLGTSGTPTTLNFDLSATNTALVNDKITIPDANIGASTLAGTVNFNFLGVELYGADTGKHYVITPPSGTWTSPPGTTNLTVGAAPDKGTELFYTMGADTSGVYVDVEYISPAAASVFTQSPNDAFTTNIYTWQGGNGSGDWGTPGNWTGGPAGTWPSISNPARFPDSSASTVNLTAPHVVGTLGVGGITGIGTNVTLTINGSGANYLSVVDPSHYQLYVNAGSTLQGSATLYLANGLDMNGGTVAGSLTINGFVGIYGGLIKGTPTINSPGTYANTATVLLYNGSVTNSILGDSSSTLTINTPYIEVLGPTSSAIYGGSIGGTNNIINIDTSNNFGTEGLYLASYLTASSASAAGGSITGTGTINGNVYDWFGSFGSAATAYTINGNVTVGNTAYAATTALSSTFAGTNVIHGNVMLGGKAAGGTSIAAAPVSFTGGNTISGNLTVNEFTVTSATNVTISPHNGTSGIGTLTVGGNMALDASTVLNFNLGAPDAPGSLGTNSDYIKVSGNLALAGMVNAVSLPGFKGGTTYTLITYGGAETGTLTVGSMPLSALYTYTIDTSIAGKVNLNAAQSGSATTWQVSSGNWTAPGSWNNGVPNSTSGVFLSGSGPHTVNVDAAAAFSAMGVTDNGAWAISGSPITLGAGGLTYLSGGSSTISAKLTGSGGLSVYNGPLTLDTAAHDYTGPTIVGAGGTLTVNSTISGTSFVTVNGGAALNGSGSIAAAPITLLPGGTLGGSLTIGGNIAVTGGSTIANAPVIGGSPVINGALGLASNILNVSGAVTGGGLWTTTSGTINNTGSIGNPITMNGNATLGGTGGIYAGTVTLNSGGGYPIINGSNLQFNGSLVTTGGNTLTVNGSVGGSGTWTIPAGNTVSDAGTIGNAIHLTGGTLQGNGTFSGAVTATSGTISGGQFTGGLTTSGGTIIAPSPYGGLGVFGTITATGAVSTTATTFNFDLGSTNESDLLAVTGTAVLAGTLNTNFHYSNLPAGVHTYTLCTTSSGSPDISGLSWSAPSNAYMTNTGLVSGSGALTVTYTRAANIPFTYTGGGNWDTPADWNVGSLIVPAAGDTATFDLAASPTLLLFGNNGETVGSLVLQNSGTLTLNNWNVAFTGGTTTIAGGQTITGTSELHVGAGATLNGSGTVDNQNGYSLSLYSGGTLSGTLAITGNVNVGSGAGKTITPATAGTTGRIAVSGTLTTDANTTFNYDLGTASDLITITGTGSTLAGSVNVAAQPGFASTIGANACTLMTYSGSAPANSLALGAKPTNACLSYGPITAAGGVVGFTVTRTNGLFTWTGGGGNADWNQIGNWDMAGITPVTGDSVVFNQAGQTLNLDAPHSVAAATLSGGSVTLTVNGASSSSVLTVTGPGGIAVGAGQTLGGNGYIATGAGGIALSGTGSLLGSLHVTGNVSATGGTIRGTPTIGGSLTVTPGNVVTITPHGDAPNSVGTLTVGAGMTLDHSTTLNFNLGPAGTIGSGINDFIDITGNLSLDGTLNVTDLTGFGAGTYMLMAYTGTLSGAGLTLGTIPSTGDFSYTIDTATGGQVNLDVTTPISGDTNRDGAVNSLDIDAIYHHFGAAATSQWKVATDGLPVGQQDVTYELHTYFHTNYADANLDRKTDFVDFQVLLDHWQASGPSIGWAQGDFDGSGTVDFLDFQKLLDYWNPGGWSFAPAQTPEPATLSLLALGGLALSRRRETHYGR